MDPVDFKKKSALKHIHNTKEKHAKTTIDRCQRINRILF